ncbi:MAG TPA: hypothetical protein DIT07_15190 [Sphingobacteriaceae bacterium]|nr:hypothetical protein [Sphingobacteriaceae bacterium]
MRPENFYLFVDTKFRWINKEAMKNDQSFLTIIDTIELKLILFDFYRIEFLICKKTKDSKNGCFMYRKKYRIFLFNGVGYIIF